MDAPAFLAAAVLNTHTVFMCVALTVSHHWTLVLSATLKKTEKLLHSLGESEYTVDHRHKQTPVITEEIRVLRKLSCTMRPKVSCILFNSQFLF